MGTRRVLQEARPKGRATGGRTVGALVNNVQPAMGPLSTPLLRQPATETDLWSQMLTFDMKPHVQGALIGSALGVVVCADCRFYWIHVGVHGAGVCSIPHLSEFKLT